MDMARSNKYAKAPEDTASTTAAIYPTLNNILEMKVYSEGDHLEIHIGERRGIFPLAAHRILQTFKVGTPHPTMLDTMRLHRHLHMDSRWELITPDVAFRRLMGVLVRQCQAADILPTDLQVVVKCVCDVLLHPNRELHPRYHTAMQSIPPRVGDVYWQIIYKTMEGFAALDPAGTTGLNTSIDFVMPEGQCCVSRLNTVLIVEYTATDGSNTRWYGCIPTAGLGELFRTPALGGISSVRMNGASMI